MLIVLRKAFDTFDVEKKGSIGTVMIGTILGMLGIQTTEKTLQDIINEVDEDGMYSALNFTFLFESVYMQVPENWSLKNLSRWLLDL